MQPSEPSFNWLVTKACPQIFFILTHANQWLCFCKTSQKPEFRPAKYPKNPQMDKPLRIFLIEDDMDDIELLQDSLKDNRVPFTMNIVREGDKVSTYLKECTVLPHVIVMDFNLPKVHGKDILKTIKSFDGFKDIPLLVLTTSTAKDDIDYSYKMGADMYLTKPSNIKGFNETVAAIVELATR